MTSNGIKVFLINLILCVLCSNGLLLLRSAIVRIPFRFNFYWGVIAPILCAVAVALSIVVRNSERACQK